VSSRQILAGKTWRIFKRCIVGGLVAFVVLAAIFYPFTLTQLGRFLILSEQPERANLILILGGDFWGPRVLKGAELGTAGYAPKIIISGPPYNNRPESDLAIQFLVEHGFRRELFVGEPMSAKSTIEESIAVCPELTRLGAKKVLIVTSSFHSRRANIVFRLFCPGIQFLSIAAEDPKFQAEKWWRNEQCQKLFFSEWEKILGSVFWSYPEWRLRRFWEAITGLRAATLKRTESQSPRPLRSASHSAWPGGTPIFSGLRSRFGLSLY
jgi:uncharacterized SAM-binding protein YcdF (DUF218 family)